MQNRTMDPRIARTRRSLQEALLDLAREQAPDDIAVADIAERAGVNRSSFYQHYADKETLLADALDAAAEDAGAGLPATIEVGAAPPVALLTYLEHLDANAALYRQVLGAHGSPVAVARLRARLEGIVLDGMARSDVPIESPIPADVVAASIAGSVLGVLAFWLDREPRPAPAVASEWVWVALVRPGWMPVA